MNPTTGRIVQYRLTADQAQQINKRRADFARFRGTPEYSDTGYAAHVGNFAQAGDIVPLLVVRAWSPGTGVNGQAFLDGTDNLWVTSATEGDNDGQWSWPPRV